MLKMRSQKYDSKVKALVKSNARLKKDLSLAHDKAEEAIKGLKVACEDVRSGFQTILSLVC